MTDINHEIACSDGGTPAQQAARFGLRRLLVALAERRKWALEPWRRFCVRSHHIQFRQNFWLVFMLQMMQLSIVSTISKLSSAQRISFRLWLMIHIPLALSP